MGVVGGYKGGWVDTLLMRLGDIVMAFPSLILAMVVTYTLGASFFTLFIALSVVGWASAARVVRSQTLSLKQREFVAASRAVGVRRPASCSATSSRTAWRPSCPADPGHPRRHHGRGWPEFPGRRRATAHAKLGADGQRGADTSFQRPGLPSSRGWRSWSPSWLSTSSATACATRWIRICGGKCEACASPLSLRSACGLKAQRRRALPLGRALADSGHTVALFVPPYDSPEDSGRQWREAVARSGDRPQQEGEAGVDIINVRLPSGRGGAGVAFPVGLAPVSGRARLAARRRARLQTEGAVRTGRDAFVFHPSSFILGHGFRRLGRSGRLE